MLRQSPDLNVADPHVPRRAGAAIATLGAAEAQAIAIPQLGVGLDDWKCHATNPIIHGHGAQIKRTEDFPKQATGRPQIGAGPSNKILAESRRYLLKALASLAAPSLVVVKLVRISPAIEPPMVISRRVWPLLS